MHQRQRQRAGPGSPQSPGTETFAKLADKAGIDPTAVFAAQSYDAAFLLAMAIEKNGSADREGLSKALREVAGAPGEKILPGEWAKAKKLIDAGQDVDYEGASGDAEFDKNGDVPGVVVEMAVENGKFVTKGPVGE